MKGIYALVFVINSYSVNCQTPFIESENFQGKVKSIEESYSYFSMNFTVEKWMFHNRFEFNKFGGITSWKKYHKNGSLKSEEVFKYLKKSNQKTKHLQYGSRKNLNGEHHYEYDDNGFLVGIWKIFNRDPNNKVLTLKMEYDSNGHKINQLDYGTDGEIIIECTYTYNENGTMDSSTMTMLKIDRMVISKYKFDKNGFMIELKRFDEEGNQIDHWNYEKDDLGNETALKAFNPDGSIKYQTRSDYEFDSHRNWTKKTHYGIYDTSVTTRVFEYYK